MAKVKRNVQKEEWLRQAEIEYQRIFGGRDADPLVTFRQIEACAVESGDRLARWLLEKKLNEDQGESPGSCCCPTCKRPAIAKAQGRERREVIAKPGAVRFDRRGFYCPSCRRVFFPSGPEA